MFEAFFGRPDGFGSSDFAQNCRFVHAPSGGMDRRAKPRKVMGFWPRKIGSPITQWGGDPEISFLTPLGGCLEWGSK